MPHTLLRLAGAGTGFDGEGLRARRMRTAVGHGSGGEPGEELSPVEVARVAREQGSLVLAAVNPDLVQPLARRAERVPMVTGSPGAQAVAPTSGAAPAVPRLVHRPAPAPAEPDDESPPRSPARRADARPLPWDALSSGSQASIDPAHLHRLADQVVQVIDDRMVATRERMGRI